eukprot:gnl/MRDRNA2_/MRDRNA2_42189_c0_seq1.p1 gnl/MRDRNA2_/MRDRNA2_42189_c0~~gnl/MRDRNA2_/MRDRNA2_42189_c0_seq1.p1  ORF type:complete len:316 (+),score=40.15 gnl/MRDRNA2_/MRDRNA2_42189_c0_seq1:109-1056(+)
MQSYGTSAANTTSARPSTIFGDAAVIGFSLLPAILQMWSAMGNSKFPLYFYYPGMTIFPAIFIWLSGNTSAYMNIAKNELKAGFLKLFTMSCIALVGSFLLQVLCNGLLGSARMENPSLSREQLVPSWFALHGDISTWRMALWEVPWNLSFLMMNPAIETFFWRIFLHREMAVRFFWGKRPEEEKLPSQEGDACLDRSGLPVLSHLGCIVNALIYGGYHYIVFCVIDVTGYDAALQSGDGTSPATSTYLLMLAMVVWVAFGGLGILHARQHPHWGILAAWMLHMGPNIENNFTYSLSLKHGGLKNPNWSLIQKAI